MRGEYNTRHKREMLTFLQAHEYEPFTVDEFVFRMREQGEDIGRTTAYRYLEQLSDAGNVRKYQNPQGATCYQHISDCAACDAHFHMLCRRCGRLFHVDCELMDSLAEHIRRDHGFILDPRETVLKGICATCSNGEEVGPDGACHAEGCHHCV